MSASELLGLHPTDDPLAWKVHAHVDVVTAGGALQGGVAFGAAIDAMVVASGRPLVWASAQFLSHAAPDTMLDLEVTLPVAGHRVSQARSRLAHGDDEVMSALAALGSRDMELTHVWPTLPDVPPAEECPARAFPRDDLLNRWDGRIASGRTPDQLDGAVGSGRSASWYRRPFTEGPLTAGELAVIGDFTMAEMSDAVGFLCIGNSLDQTLRVHQLVDTTWVLVDASVTLVADGFGWISANLWSGEGEFLGVFSQTLVLRRVGDAGRPIRTAKRFAGG